MSNIDVTTHWQSQKSEIPIPVRLRIIEDQGKTLALLSAPLKVSEEQLKILDQQLDAEFEQAATRVASLFSLNAIETIWLRESLVDGKTQIRRVIMDEKNGVLINSRTGILNSWETQAINQRRYFLKKNSLINSWRWSYVVIVGLLFGIIFLILHLSALKRSLHQKESQLQVTSQKLEEMAQKVLMINLIEKERQQAEGIKSSLKRIYRQSTNEVIKLPAPEKSSGVQASEPQKNWVEHWNEEIFKKSSEVEESNKAEIHP